MKNDGKIIFKIVTIEIKVAVIYSGNPTKIDLTVTFQTTTPIPPPKRRRYANHQSLQDQPRNRASKEHQKLVSELVALVSQSVAVDRGQHSSGGLQKDK